MFNLFKKKDKTQKEMENDSKDIYNADADDSQDINESNNKGFFSNLLDGLKKTRDNFGLAMDNLFKGKAKIDDDLFDEIEELLISADVGVDTTMEVIDTLRDNVREKHIREVSMIKSELMNIMKEKITQNNLDNKIEFKEDVPKILLIIGVNGVGKTTTIGKLAKQFKREGKTVLLAAADTYRAAAIEQLTEWANRSNVDIISHQEGADPASVIFDAIKSQEAKKTDVLICDTAGRLHNKKNLMNELEKISRVIKRESPNADLETILVLDSTTGQNAVHQAREFSKVADINGYILTKMDGTAKGGVVFPLQVELNVPVKYIGIGEKVEDLRPFDPDEFVEAIFS